MSTRIRAMLVALGVAVLVTIPVNASAQSTSDVVVGAKAGLNSATVKVKGDSDPDRLWGGVGGLFLRGQVNDSLGLQIEGLFSQRGAKFDDGFDKGQVRLTYIDVPLLVKLGGKASGGARFYVFTGPQASYRLNAEATDDATDITVDLKDDIEDLDFGWTAGLGVDANRLTLDARYTHGLKNISTDKDDDVKNRTFTVMIGVRLR